MSDGIPYLDGRRLRELVPIVVAVDVLEDAFRRADMVVPPRAHLPAGPGELLVMPATGPAGTGVKLVTVNPSNPPERALINGIYVLFDPSFLEPVLIVDGAAVTALRTPAVSAVATRALAPEDASRLVIFGAGIQATGHLDAMCTVLDITSVVVVARSIDSANELVIRARDRGLEARAGSPDDVRTADVVCTCTSSTSPLFDGSLLPHGAHVNAIGAYKPHARELDDRTIARSTIVVEDKASAASEAGDLVQPMESGLLDIRNVVELGDVLRDGRPYTPGKDVTVFKSVGLASEDLAVVSAAFAAFED